MTGKPGSLTSTAFQTGVIMERERIIKLLEEQSFTTLHDEVGVSERLDVLIALIKGETKTNFETYLEEQIKNPEIKEAFEQGEGERQNYNETVIHLTEGENK